MSSGHKKSLCLSVTSVKSCCLSIFISQSTVVHKSVIILRHVKTVCCFREIEDPEKQRKMEEREARKDKKRGAPKIKQLKVKNN